MLLTNYAITSQGQTRSLGGNLNPTVGLNLARMNTFYVGDNSSLAPFPTNLVPNGNFEKYPPFYAPTSTGGTVINGKASGDSTDTEQFFWRWGKSGTAEVYYDTSTKYSGSASMKLSTKAVASYVELYLNIDGLATNYAGRVIPVTPDATYTYSFMMKTNYVSGDATQGAAISFIKRQSDGTTAGSASVTTSYVKTTTDWTRYTGTITTTATDAYICISARVYGHTGTGTLIMDAWFDDIQIYPTDQITRSLTDSNRDYFSQPAQGLRPPYSLVLAPKAGGMSLWDGGTGSTTATGIQGLFTTADLGGNGTISNAAMGLTVEMVATLASTGSLTATIIGALEASATLSGQGTVTAGIGALAGLVATLTGTGSLTATQIATGLMEAVIYVNQSEATIEQLVEGVVQGLIDMGATGGLTAEEHAQLMKTLTTNKFLGLK